MAVSTPWKGAAAVAWHSTPIRVAAGNHAVPCPGHFSETTPSLAVPQLTAPSAFTWRDEQPSVQVHLNL